MEISVGNLKIKRGHIKGQLTRFETFLTATDGNNLNDNIIKELSHRLQKIQCCYDKYLDIQNEIGIVNPNEDTESDTSEFENCYFNLTSHAESLIDKFHKQKEPIPENIASVQRLSSGSSSRGGSSDVIKLPTIKLPIFQGNYNSWPEFRDLFIALIDSNDSLNPIQKFYYLKTSLAKEPQKIIANLDTTADNYTEAWELLKERYENKPLMIHNHIKAILEKPGILKESHIELRELFDSISDHLLSLKSLGEKVDSWDRLIIYIICQKFDKVTRRGWETFKIEGDLPEMQDMRNFLKERCQMLEKLASDNSEKSKSSFVNNKLDNKFKKFNNTSHSLHSNTKEPKCYYCGKNHTMYTCDEFLKMSISKRIDEIKKRNFCMICFSPYHETRECKLKKCFKCNKAHNSLIHLENFSANSFCVVENSTVGGAPTNTDNVANSGIFELEKEGDESAMAKVTDFTDFITPVAEQILLSTAIMKLKIGDNIFKVRILLDSGSQSSFITKSLCDKLKIDTFPITHTVKGVGQGIIKIKYQVNLHLMSLYDSFSMYINCLVLDKITECLPKISFNKSKLNIPEGIKLADPTFNISSDIDILLGSQVFWTILMSGQKLLGPNLPVLQNSRLGWIIAGNLGLNSNTSLTHLSINSDDFEYELDKQIARFWVLEEVQNTIQIMSKEDEYCEEFFENNLKKDITGRFIVKIPFKANVGDLGSSHDIALKRFLNLEKRLLKNGNLREDYVRFMREYIELGHMSELLENDKKQNGGYFIPHHAVVKNSSITTRCRVVFDASCATDNGISLNDVQYIGPPLQNDIFDILVRFRKHKYVIAGDISKMYRQILVSPEDKKYQKIFWRSDTSEELKSYQLNTVTYGTASAPYLAVRSLLQVAKENSENHPLASNIIKRDFYVDDVLTGGESKTEILQIQKDLSTILANYGFHLRKWLCNDFSILNKFKINKELDNNILPLGNDELNKTLGVYWNAKTDVLQYSVNVQTSSIKLTKRTILSIICQIYDPLGLINPIIVLGKLFMQELWKLKLSWDDEVPEKIKIAWMKFQNELDLINTLTIPRLCVFADYSIIELHALADASEKAYGGAIYLRCFVTNKGYFSNLLCAKSRVAPLKKISIPRLELCAAVLVANLADKVCKSIQVNFNSRFYWTDSTVTLAWIKAEPNVWKTFVANRVTEIQSISSTSEWFHVGTKYNPADLLSRGVNPETLAKLSLWWYGPAFLCSNHLQSVIADEVDTISDIPEKRNISSVLLSVDNFDCIQHLINRCSNYLKLLRITAYILRFKNNICKSTGKNKLVGVLKPEELDNALILLVKIVQVECFSREYNSLLQKKGVEKKSKILSLTPFLHNQVIRFGGRLENSNMSFHKKHPIILPKSHHFTDLIIRHEHERLMHCGVQMLLCTLREQFWPVSGKNCCKKIVRNCVRCFKVKPNNCSYLMGNLPNIRVNESLPFLNVGIDYGGPFSLKDRQGRGAKISKCFICLFICMSSKAIHLELVTGLTTDAFMSALKRFIGRRGKPNNIYSDNGTNFSGANRELNDIYNFVESEHNKISSHLINDKIRWHFIPARSPTFGGIWEAGIKSVKSHLKKVVGESVFTFENFNTVLIQIESILNSRPLCPLTNDPNDLTPLTPSHLLIGRSLIALPEGDVTNIPTNRLNQYQQIQSVVQSFWKRWQREYLSQFQIRSKWKEVTPNNFRIGTLVLLKDENLPPLCWALGRISAIFPGSDGVVRVCEVKTNKGQYRRGVNKLCVLPIN